MSRFLLRRFVLSFCAAGRKKQILRFAQDDSALMNDSALMMTAPWRLDDALQKRR
jgi:hypothetical protein